MSAVSFVPKGPPAAGGKAGGKAGAAGANAARMAAMARAAAPKGALAAFNGVLQVRLLFPLLRRGTESPSLH